MSLLLCIRTRLRRQINRLILPLLCPLCLIGVGKGSQCMMRYDGSRQFAHSAAKKLGKEENDQTYPSLCCAHQNPSQTRPYGPSHHLKKNRNFGKVKQLSIPNGLSMFQLLLKLDKSYIRIFVCIKINKRNMPLVFIFFVQNYSF